MIAPLALTMGEPAGIGGELTLLAWRRRQAEALPPFFTLDDPARLEQLAAALGWTVPLRRIAAPEETATLFPQALPVLPVALSGVVAAGQPDPANAPAVIEAIRLAATLAGTGRAAALVTNPIQKETLYAAGFRHPGHTEFLAELAGGAEVAMMLACPELRVVPVTVHLPLRAA
ncbi:MAG TPA: 4-hydroxythreonine-4-phosphate dehydrogenase PdxA, partial [Stellaceae bacterium]|nr:4-hydroxythreonine-4-phosphate dehydrogenase PdxA [Stellaceae bacterium]